MNNLKILVTGGAGFIGSHFVKLALKKSEVRQVINLDKLTYAGNPATLKPVEEDPKYQFIKGDIADASLIDTVFKNGIDMVVNFAAETHVDRSIQEAGDFIKTDIQGVWVLLEACRRYGIKKFIQISTDEVYGSIAEGSFTETAPLMPSNPYSASKAGGDRLAYSYWKTYQLPVVVTRCSNNYGPYQYPEKLIPLFVTNALENKKLPLYGDGLNRRDWIHVLDHCEAVWFLTEKGENGETYNIAGRNELTNLVLTRMILDEFNLDPSMIQPVKDRPGHDRRYAIDDSRLRKLGWTSQIPFEKGLKETLQWYKENTAWWEPIKHGEFKQYYQQQYGAIS
ncbi:MAG: dTDP-glucose 4,6-dehydratase [Candidatus Aureabacteria bacterium]|nr:dTDP-glucose 4,6-dehydratase [Candidatus Auribacterota bacterium]